MKDLSTHLQRLYRKVIFNSDSTMIVDNTINHNPSSYGSFEGIRLNALIDDAIQVLNAHAFISTHYPSIVFSLRR